MRAVHLAFLEDKHYVSIRKSEDVPKLLSPDFKVDLVTLQCMERLPDKLHVSTLLCES